MDFSFFVVKLAEFIEMIDGGGPCVVRLLAIRARHAVADEATRLSRATLAQRLKQNTLMPQSPYRKSDLRSLWTHFGTGSIEIMH